MNSRDGAAKRSGAAAPTRPRRTWEILASEQIFSNICSWFVRFFHLPECLAPVASHSPSSLAGPRPSRSPMSVYGLLPPVCAITLRRGLHSSHGLREPHTTTWLDPMPGVKTRYVMHAFLCVNLLMSVPASQCVQCRASALGNSSAVLTPNHVLVLRLLCG